jgi:hypothetical protein
MLTALAYLAENQHCPDTLGYREHFEALRENWRLSRSEGRPMAEISPDDLRALIGREVGLSKNTVAEIVKRSRSLQPAVAGSP